MDKDVIVVFGGCFSPPTNAHFSLGQQLADEYPEIDMILYVPVSDHYQKDGLVHSRHRVAMLRAVAAHNPRFGVSMVEVDADRQLCTIETLEILQSRYPDKRIWFTIGTDNLKSMASWKKYSELLSRFKLLVIERDRDNMDEIIEADPFLKSHKDSFIRAKETIRNNNSSTLIRQKIRNGKSLRYLVPDEVIQYIQTHRIFDE